MTIKTNSKEFNNSVNNYILNNINPSDYDVELNSEFESLKFLADTFKKEYLFRDNLKRYKTYQNVLASWLMGLPSCFNNNINYTDCKD